MTERLDSQSPADKPCECPQEGVCLGMVNPGQRCAQSAGTRILEEPVRAALIELVRLKDAKEWIERGTAPAEVKEGYEREKGPAWEAARLALEGSFQSASERTGGECPTCGIDASFNDVRFIDAADTWTEEKLLVLDALDEIDALRRGVGVTHMAGHDPVQRLRQWLPKREQLELGKSIRAKVRAKWATNNPTDSRVNRG